MELPLAIEGHPLCWAAVGPGNEDSNHSRNRRMKQGHRGFYCLESVHPSDSRISFQSPGFSIDTSAKVRIDDERLLDANLYAGDGFGGQRSRTRHLLLPIAFSYWRSNNL